MPAPLARGIIITVTVLVAATVAAYENPHVRAWIDRTRHKIAMSLHSLGDEVSPRPRPRRSPTSNDASMHEDKSEEAESRRRQAIAQIVERGRMMEDKRRRSRTANSDTTQPSTFDTLVDTNGMLLQHTDESPSGQAASSSVATNSTEADATLRQRHGLSDSRRGVPHLDSASDQTHCPPTLRQLSPRPVVLDREPLLESGYEREMREGWRIPLPPIDCQQPSSHASESLIELTPTSEDAPDPDFSIPDPEHGHPYFPRAGPAFPPSTDPLTAFSASDHQTFSPDQRRHLFEPHFEAASSSGGSYVSGAAARPRVSLMDEDAGDVHVGEVADDTDDPFSDLGDGIRTPASAWTEVDSIISGDFGGVRSVGGSSIEQQ